MHHKQLLPFSKAINIDLPDDLNILVVESNTFSGASARRAFEIITKEYPEAKLYYATVTQVYHENPSDLNMYKKTFVATMTNENSEADEETINKLNLRRGISIYPWETTKFELQDINDAFNE